MVKKKSLTLWEDLEFRGLIASCSNAKNLETHLNENKVNVYAGFDPTSDSLHIGSLLPIVTLARMQRAGHTPILLVGGGTGLIGDPSGKAGERSLNDEETVHNWTNSIRQQVENFLDFKSPINKAVLVNNYDWLSKLSSIGMLREVGKHFSIRGMLAKESVKSRLSRSEEGISYTEFSYMILQAYDFLHLSRNNNCTLQLGGSDQYGNMAAGIELIKKLDKKEAHALSIPLFLKADGTKFGKTEQGTIWLDENKTSPYELYQFLLNVADADVIQSLKYFTFLTPEEITSLELEVAQNPQERAAQKILANEVTTFIHGPKALEQAQRVTQAFFRATFTDLNQGDFNSIVKHSPTLKVNPIDIERLNISDYLVLTQLTPSYKRAQSLLEDGAIKVNGYKIGPGEGNLKSSLLHNKFLVVSRGKKTHHIIESDPTAPLLPKGFSSLSLT